MKGITLSHQTVLVHVLLQKDQTHLHSSAIITIASLVTVLQIITLKSVVNNYDGNVYYTRDPVWDGLECSLSVNCCAQPEMPWFF